MLRESNQLKALRFIRKHNLYSYDPVSGVISSNRTGNVMNLNMGLTKRYPEVTFHVGVDFMRSLGRKGCSISIAAHRFAAYCLWGDAAFTGKTQILHGPSGVMCLKASNLRLGDAFSNMGDISPEVRSASARKARASQPSRPNSAKLTDDQVRHIRRTYVRIPGTANPVAGEVTRLARKYSVAPSTISLLLRNQIYKDVR